MPLSFAVAALADDAAGSLIKRTTISCERAEEIALQKYPGATVKEIKLDGEDLPLTWEIELRHEKHDIDLDIDAKSGEITHTDKH